MRPADLISSTGKILKGHGLCLAPADEYLHQLSTRKKDVHLCLFLHKQMKFIKELKDPNTNLSKMRGPELDMAEYLLHKLGLGHSSKKR